MKLRKPIVKKNKCNLTVKDIEKFIIFRFCLEKLKTRCWHNNIVNALCYSKGFVKGYFDYHISSFWIGFYFTQYYIKYFKVKKCSWYEGIFRYKFNKFFNYRNRKNEYDLLSQKAVFEFANWPLDEKYIKEEIRNMGVSKETFLIVGCDIKDCLTDKFEDWFWYYEGKKYQCFQKEGEVQIIDDGMCSEYTYIGYIIAILEDDWDELKKDIDVDDFEVYKEKTIDAIKKLIEQGIINKDKVDDLKIKMILFNHYT